MMRPRSKTRFMESMWRDLPASLLDKVFTFLPIASLCQFRTLSKEWNRFITSPTFKQAGALEEDYALITSRWGRPVGDWVVLDVARNRYFTLSAAFLTEHAQRQWLVDAVDAADARKGMLYPAASDGGLFCVQCSFNVKTSGLFVCNPVLKTVKQLPHVAGVWWGDFVHGKVVMATDRSSMEYEIFIVNTAMRNLGGEPSQPKSILVYESKTGRWRTAPYQPFSQMIWWGTLTIFNNNQYCIFNKEDSYCAGLVSYNKETGVVSDLVGIDFPFAIGSLLVVSNARLFCVIPAFSSVEIFEIDVVKRLSTRLTEMPMELLIWVLGHDLESIYGEMESKIEVATGSADGILIATVVGRCGAYSLSHKSWSQFPADHTLLEEYNRENMKLTGIYWRHNCLSLCAP